MSLIREKLAKYSEFLYKAYDMMDNDTILMVTGDHGMTNEGSHGGNTQDEVGTVLFATTKGDNKFFKEFGKLS
jgi:phosphatidylinositol glycan class O